MFGVRKFATVFLTLALLACYNNGAPAGDPAVPKVIDAKAPVGIKNEIAVHVEPKEYQDDQEKTAAGAENVMNVRLQPNDDPPAEGAADAAPAKKGGAAALVFKPEMFVVMLSIAVVKSFVAM